MVCCWHVQAAEPIYPKAFTRHMVGILYDSKVSLLLFNPLSLKALAQVLCKLSKPQGCWQEMVMQRLYS